MWRPLNSQAIISTTYFPTSHTPKGQWIANTGIPPTYFHSAAHYISIPCTNMFFESYATPLIYSVYLFINTSYGSGAGVGPF